MKQKTANVPYNSLEKGIATREKSRGPMSMDSPLMAVTRSVSLKEMLGHAPHGHLPHMIPPHAWPSISQQAVVPKGGRGEVRSGAEQDQDLEAS